MGYRELLKRYIRFLEVNVGDSYIESIPSARERLLSDRDLAELRTLAGEIYRGEHTGDDLERIENYNYRFRVLLNRYNLRVEDAASLAGSNIDAVRRWRTSPRSERYLNMSQVEFDRFESALTCWLEARGETISGDRTQREERHDGDGPH